MAARTSGDPIRSAALADAPSAVAVVSEGTGGPTGAEAARAAADSSLHEARRSQAVDRTFAAARAAAAATLGPEDEEGGASLLAAWIDRTGTLTLAHLGSVRGYLWRPAGRRAAPEPAAARLCPAVEGKGGRLVCLTRDHSMVCDLVEGGHLDAASARAHPLRTRLTRGVRKGDDSAPDVARLGLYPGDRLVLCSAGLWTRVDDEAIAAALAEHSEAAGTCDALAAAVVASGKARSFGLVVVDCFPPRERGANGDARPGGGGEGPAGGRRDAPKPDPRPDGQRKPMPPEGGPKGGPRDGRVDGNRDGGRRDSDEPPPEDRFERLGRDITELARQGALDGVIGREKEIRQLAQALVARRKSNAVLIGPPGVGKTAIVEGTAIEMAEGRLGSRFAAMRIVEVAMGAIVAGTKYRGQFEERMLAVVRAAEEDPNLVIFIDELHTAMGAGATASHASDAADLLKPALARGSMRLIGATTTEEYQKFIERDAAFARRLTVIEVAEPSVEQTVEILRGLQSAFERHYEVRIDDDCFEAAARLSARYVVGRYLPDKAIDLIDRACSRLLVAAEPGDRAGRLRRSHVVELVADMCAVDVELIGRDIREARERVGELEAFLRARIFGQDAALGRVARQIERAYGGLKDPKRPIASYLFVGPTGVGKTETAKVVAEFLFHDRDRVLRIDMSEYHDRWAISRLIGAPPGYIGHDEEGQLTGPILRHGARVVLFDEIEKSHPDVLLVLLQILDEGRLTDARGRVASFHEAVVIMTSNLLQGGLPKVGKRIGFQQDEGSPEEDGANASMEERDALRRELARSLRPELVGRIGEIVRFEPLSRGAARAIAEARSRAAIARLRAQGGALELPKGFADEVLDRLGDLKFGARGIERIVDERIGELLDDAMREAEARGPGEAGDANAGTPASARPDRERKAEPGDAGRGESDPDRAAHGARAHSLRADAPAAGDALPPVSPSPPRSGFDPASSMRASLRPSARNDVAMLAVVPSLPLDDSTRRALVTSLCIGPGAAQVREIDAGPGRIIVLCATLPAALAMGRRHATYRGIDLRRVVHRGRVQHDAERRLRGVGLHLVERMIEATADDASSSRRLFVTSSAYDAMEADLRAGLVPFEGDRLGSWAEGVTLWVEREDVVR